MFICSDATLCHTLSRTYLEQRWGGGGMNKPCSPKQTADIAWDYRNYSTDMYTCTLPVCITAGPGIIILLKRTPKMNCWLDVDPSWGKHTLLTSVLLAVLPATRLSGSLSQRTHNKKNKKLSLLNSACKSWYNLPNYHQIYSPMLYEA